MSEQDIVTIQEIITDLLKNFEKLTKLANEQRIKCYMTRGSEIASMYESNADDFLNKADELALMAIDLKSNYIE